MKKYAFIILAIFLSICIAAKATSSASAEFLHKLSTCEEYIHDDGRKITMVLGWTNRRCFFQEITHNRTIICGLNEIELEHFTQEIKNEYDSQKGLAPIKKVRPYFQSLDTCLVRSRKPDNTGL